MDRIIIKAISKDPNERYENVEAVMEDFGPLAEAERDLWNLSPPTPDTSILRPEDLSA